MGMFSPKTNDGFYELGLAVVHSIAERIEQEGVGRTEVSQEKFHAGDGAEGGGDGGGEKTGWKEERDSQGRTIWVET